MPPLYMDAYPATNDDYAQYLAQSGNAPPPSSHILPRLPLDATR